MQSLHPSIFFFLKADPEEWSQDSSHPRVPKLWHQRVDFERYRQCLNFQYRYDRWAFESRSVCTDECFERWIQVWLHWCDVKRTCHLEDEHNRTVDFWILIYVWTQSPQQCLHQSTFTVEHEIRSPPYLLLIMICVVWLSEERERKKERDTHPRRTNNSRLTQNVWNWQ